MAPFFSIVIPTFNRAKIIEAALQSIFAQRFTDYEIIIVDDGSTDDTVDVISRLRPSSPRPMRLETQKNAGPGAARNSGFAMATGQYIALLDSDDLWFPWTLELYHQCIVAHAMPSFVCGVPVDIYPGEAVKSVDDQSLRIEKYPDFYAVPGNPFFRFTTSGVAIRKASIDEVHGMTTQGFEDLDLWMRLGTQNGYLLITNPPIAVRRLLGNNLSNERKYNQSGTSTMIETEQSDAYPGGVGRRGDRRRLLHVLMRAASFQMANSGDLRGAWSIYWKVFPWSLQQGRLRYLLGLPLKVLLCCLGKTQ